MLRVVVQHSEREPAALSWGASRGVCVTSLVYVEAEGARLEAATLCMELSSTGASPGVVLWLLCKGATSNSDGGMSINKLLCRFTAGVGCCGGLPGAAVLTVVVPSCNGVTACCGAGSEVVVARNAAMVPDQEVPAAMLLEMKDAAVFGSAK